MAKFTCEICGNNFQHNYTLRRHIRIRHQTNFECTTCDLKFTNREEFLKHSHLIEHIRKVEEASLYCNVCKIQILKRLWTYHLRTNAHKNNYTEITDNNIKCIKNMFKNRIATYVIENENKTSLIPENFLSSIKDKVIALLKDIIQKHSSIKFNFELFCKYMLIKETDDSFTIETKSHQTKMIIVNSTLTTNDITQHYSNQSDILMKKMSEFQERDSGWTLTEISHLEININEYKCIKGSQYIPLPSAIMRKLACINVRNRDEYCFKWAIISALYPIDRRNKPDRCTSYKITNIEDDIIILENNITLNFKNLNFPLSVNKIKDFESNNPEISVNVFGLENDAVVGPYYFTQKEQSTHINLLLLEEGERFHYIWIKNISR